MEPENEQKEPVMLNQITITCYEGGDTTIQSTSNEFHVAIETIGRGLRILAENMFANKVVAEQQATRLVSDLTKRRLS